MNKRGEKDIGEDEFMGDKAPLTMEEVANKLKEFPDWIFEKDEISKQFEFPTFMDGISFVNELAPICERIQHHPDILIYYKKIMFKLQRYHSGQKVTSLDFMIAREIENLYQSKYADSAKQSLCSV